MQKLRKSLESPQMQEKAYSTADGAMQETRMILWFYAGTDVTGVLASMNKIAGTMEEVNLRNCLLEYIIVSEKLVLKQRRMFMVHLEIISLLMNVLHSFSFSIHGPVLFTSFNFR